MAKRAFTEAERYAVYVAHLEKCYMCGTPIDLLSMEVDHVIPESLAETPDTLATVLEGYGLPADFDLQSYKNLMPACGQCNNRKRAQVFNPSLRIQLELQNAAGKASRCEALEAECVRNQSLGRAWNTIKRAFESGTISHSVLIAIEEFAARLASDREAAVAGETMKFLPLLEVLVESDGIRIVRGPYGIGAEPVGYSRLGGFRCAGCGSVAWNGNRCVVCGLVNDD